MRDIEISMEQGQEQNENEVPVTAREIDGGVIVEFCTDRFNVRNAAAVLQFIQSHIKPDSNIIIILDSVMAMDSSGCGCLLRLHRQARKVNTQFMVVADNDVVHKLLLILRFDRLAPIYRELHEAINAMKK